MSDVHMISTAPHLHLLHQQLPAPDISTLHLLLQVTGKNHTHMASLSLPVQEWKDDRNYKDVDERVTKLCIVNEPTERAVKAAGDRIGSVRFEKAFQDTLLTVEELCHLSSNTKRDTKKQLPQ